jgi:O-antigen/teichoic acid export membrane protein
MTKITLLFVIVALETIFLMLGLMGVLTALVLNSINVNKWTYISSTLGLVSFLVLMVSIFCMCVTLKKTHDKKNDNKDNVIIVTTTT